MAVKSIPEGYHSVTPILIVADANKLLDFIKTVFGATEKFCARNPDGTIAHAEAQIGDSVIMFSDASSQWKPMPSCINVYVADIDAAFKCALDAGATSLREPADQFYGDRSGGVADPCGNHWWLATHIEDVSDEEMERRQAALAH